MPKPNVKEQIVTASLTLLHSKGFNATSVQDITDAAGVPKGSFYNHFASKEVLGVEVVQRYAAAVGELRPLLESDHARLTRLRQYFDRLIQANVDNDFNCGCLLGNFSTELSAQSQMIRQQVNHELEQWTRLVASVIEQAQQDGSTSTDVSASELASFILAAWEGAVSRSKAAH